MTTPLSLFGTNIASGTLATAGALASGTGGVSANIATKVGTTTQWVEGFGIGTTTTQVGVAAIPATPDGNGFLWDVTTLEGSQIIAGTWTLGAIVKSNNANSMTATYTVQVFKFNAGVFTHLFDMVAGAQTFTSASAKTYVATVTGTTVNFLTGDKLYFNPWFDITAANISATTNILVAASSTAAGIHNQMQVDTPGFQSIPVLATNNTTSVRRNSRVRGSMQPR